MAPLKFDSTYVKTGFLILKSGYGDYGLKVKISQVFY